jgi:hypothetical protein
VTRRAARRVKRNSKQRIAELRAALGAARPYVAAAVNRAPTPYAKGPTRDLAALDAALALKIT